MNRLLGYRLVVNCVAPPLAGLAALHPRLSAHRLERLAWRLPPVEPGCLWFHAASLGEGQVAAAVLDRLATRYPDLPLLRTATSAAGRAQELPVDVRACLPLDLPFFTDRFVRRVRPRALVLVEGELWPALLSSCQGRLPVAMLATRVGQGTRRFARAMPGLFRALTGCVQHWSARDAAAAAWLEERLQQPVCVLGDLKAEAPVPAPSLHWARPAVVAGSTQPGEELLVLDALAGLVDRPLLVLAPRRPERFGEVAALLEARGLRWTRRSALDGQVPPDVDVVLLDTVGELRGLYSQAVTAFVGGTFSQRIGGHSAAEPAAAGLPVVHGPLTHTNQPSFDHARCFPAANSGELARAFRLALQQPRQAPPAGKATEGALRFLAPLLDAPIPAERAHRPLLWPLVPLVRAASATRRHLARPWRAPVPVIAVGNLVSGGSGKTPVALHLADWLRAAGLRPAILSRGYRRRSMGPWLRWGQGGQSSALELGDEAAMVAQRGHLVFSCPDRALAAREALHQGAQVLVLDDGFQQTTLAADLHVVVLDTSRLEGGGPLPVGERREGWPALWRAHVVWLHGGPLPESHQRFLAPDAIQVSASYRPAGWSGPGGPLPLTALAGRVAAFAGIAHAGRFFRSLRRLGMSLVNTRAFSDHHPYSAADWQSLQAWCGHLPLVTTEKDRVRLWGEGWFDKGAPLYALQVDLALQQGEAALQAALRALLAGVLQGPQPEETAP